MSGSILLFPLYAFMVCTGTNLLRDLGVGRDSSFGLVTGVRFWQPENKGLIAFREETVSTLSDTPASYSVGSGGKTAAA
jgi:hypothetical protein